jgi:hypothetical protein
MHWQPDRILAAQSLREDVLTLLSAMLEAFHRVGIDTYRRLIADADDELLDTLNTQLTQVVHRTIYRALSGARDRGEIGTADIPDRAVTTIAVLLRNELMFTRNPVDIATLSDMLDNVYLPLIEAVSHRAR